MSVRAYEPAIKNVFHTYINKPNVFSSVMFGAGLYYTCNTKQYHHIPLVCIMPNVYAGYQGMKYIHAESITMKSHVE